MKYVESAFMGVTDPRVEEGIERCVKLGAKNHHVTILFIHRHFDGTHAWHV